MRLIIFLSLIILAPFALAEEIIEGAVHQSVNLEGYFKLLIDSLGGLKGASSLAIIAAVIQILMATLNLDVLQTKLPKIVGKYKFLFIYFLTCVSAVIALRMQGLDLLTALFHSNTLAAYQVFMHQAVKQMNEKS